MLKFHNNALIGSKDSFVEALQEVREVDTYLYEHYLEALRNRLWAVQVEAEAQGIELPQELQDAYLAIDSREISLEEIHGLVIKANTIFH